MCRSRFVLAFTVCRVCVLFGVDTICRLCFLFVNNMYINIIVVIVFVLST